MKSNIKPKLKKWRIRSIHCLLNDSSDLYLVEHFDKRFALEYFRTKNNIMYKLYHVDEYVDEV